MTPTLSDAELRQAESLLRELWRAEFSHVEFSFGAYRGPQPQLEIVEGTVMQAWPAFTGVRCTAPMIKNLTAEALCAVFAHEMAHVELWARGRGLRTLPRIRVVSNLLLRRVETKCDMRAVEAMGFRPEPLVSALHTSEAHRRKRAAPKRSKWRLTMSVDSHPSHRTRERRIYRHAKRSGRGHSGTGRKEGTVSV